MLAFYIAEEGEVLSLIKIRITDTMSIAHNYSNTNEFPILT